MGLPSVVPPAEFVADGEKSCWNLNEFILQVYGDRRGLGYEEWVSIELFVSKCQLMSVCVHAQLTQGGLKNKEAIYATKVQFIGNWNFLVVVRLLRPKRWVANSNSFRSGKFS